MLTPRAGRCRQTLVALLAALPLAGIAGCGPSKYPVNGKIVWSDGTPAKELEGGLVIFEFTQAPMCARGVIKEDGSFVLTTERPEDGVIPGPYRVLVSQLRPDETIRPRPPLPMDTRFEAFQTSGLTFTVQPGQNEPVLKVERNRSKNEPVSNVDRKKKPAR
jgi:hypothetical protein